MLEKIYLYYTNDIHSHFENWPKIRKFLQEKKKSKANTFLFDIGDFIDRFHPFTEATAGKGNVQLLNECGYDAVTIGNNEGITLSHEELTTLYEDANFDCILANLFLSDGKRPTWLKPYQIFETNSGIKIGVIGVTVPYTNFYTPLNWLVKDPFECIEDVLPYVKNNADIIIVLSHLGLSDEERIAQEFPEVDVVLGAHTHHILHEGKLVNECLLCCTGKYGQYVGEAVIEFDAQSRKILSKKTQLIPADDLPLNHDDANFSEEIFNQGKSLLSSPIAYLPEKLEANPFFDTELTRILSAGMTEWCDADCSFVNAGILIEGLDEGIVTDYDIHSICPHPINPCVVKIRGDKLKEVLVQTVEDKYAELELNGFGFRGKVFGKIVYDKIEIQGRGSGIHINIDGEKLDLDRFYQVATLDMFAFAKFFPEVTRGDKKFFLPEMIRDVLKWKLTQLYPLSNANSNDYRISY